MKPKMKTETVLTALKIIALFAFIVFCIFCIAYIILYVQSLFIAQPFDNVFLGKELLELKEQNILKYTITVACLIIISALKANVWYRAIQIIQKIKIENPFTIRMAGRLEKISYNLLYIWILGYLGSTFSYWMTNQNETANILREQLSTKGFLFIAGLLFIVSQIFRRGVELQSENDLTV